MRVKTFHLMFFVAAFLASNVCGSAEYISHDQTPTREGWIETDKFHQEYLIRAVRALCAKYGLKEIENRDLEGAFERLYGHRFYEFTFEKEGYVGFSISNVSGHLSYQSFSEPFSKQDYGNFDRELMHLLKLAEAGANGVSHDHH